MKIAIHEPGAMYKRFYGTGMQRLNRTAVRALNDSIVLAGASIFANIQAQSDGLAEIAARRMFERQKGEILNRVV